MEGYYSDLFRPNKPTYEMIRGEKSFFNKQVENSNCEAYILRHFSATLNRFLDILAENEFGVQAS